MEVSGSALANNIKAVKRAIGGKTKVLVVVKANAYGHGLSETSLILSSAGADWFGVDSVEEALLLRERGINQPILVLNSSHLNRLDKIKNQNVHLTVCDLDGLKFAQRSGLPAHLKIDTGMSRQGINFSELRDFLAKCGNLSCLSGIFTHFADADNAEDLSFTDSQLKRFKQALAVLSEFESRGGQAGRTLIVHAANSAAGLNVPESRFDMIRSGSLVYGLWPSEKMRALFGDRLKLIPALSWKTKIAQLKDIKKGSLIGYNITEKVRKDIKIGILPIGYYDGYNRLLSSKGQVLIGDKRCKVMGRVSMNLTTVDASSVENPRVGDEVVLIGKSARKGGRWANEEITAGELAQKAMTISLEVLTGINPLLPRIYVK